MKIETTVIAVNGGQRRNVLDAAAPISEMVQCLGWVLSYVTTMVSADVLPAAGFCVCGESCASVSVGAEKVGQTDHADVELRQPILGDTTTATRRMPFLRLIRVRTGT